MISTRLLLVLPCYDAAPCRRFGGVLFIVAAVFVLTDRGCCVFTMIMVCCHVHHDCDITIVIHNVLRENMMALT